MATLADPAMRLVAVDPLDVSRPELYAEDRWQEPFRQLRETSPVHYVAQSGFGPFWSVSSYKAIVEVESLPDIYSSQARWTGPNTPASAARSPQPSHRARWYG
jgi:hypothetical protein